MSETVCVKAYVCDPDALVRRGFAEESRPPHPPSSLPPSLPVLTRAWEVVFMTAFFWHCSGPIELAPSYRGTGR